MSSLRDNIDRKLLEQRIDLKYGGQKGLAEKLKTNISNISHKLKRLSPKFVKELEEVAELKIPYINEPSVKYSAEDNNNIKTLINTLDMLQKKIDEQKYENDMMKKEILNMKEKNKYLDLENKKLRAQLNSLIDAHKKVEIKKGVKR